VAAVSDPHSDGFEPGDVDSAAVGPRDVDAPYNAADREQVNAKKRSKKQAERDLDDVMQGILQHPNGRRWLGNLIFEICGLNAELMDEHYRPEAIVFKEGSRRVGILLQKHALRVNSKHYMLLIEEILGAK
jgi:hypothetical protein